MNTFIIFIILLIFIYEFTNRIQYIYNQPSIEKFQDIPLSKMTYLPSNFTHNFQHDLDIKDISKDTIVLMITHNPDHMKYCSINWEISKGVISV